MSSDDLMAWARDVDAMIGVRGRQRSEALYREPSRSPLPGRWLGCYLQPAAAFGPQWMDLEMAAEGDALRADGRDSLGAFSFSGAVDRDAGEARFEKRYAGAHTVRYGGVFDGAAVRGLWCVGISSGAFALWRAEALSDEEAERGSRCARGVGGSVLALVAMLTFPLRAVPIVRHSTLVRRFRALRPELARWVG